MPNNNTNISNPLNPSKPNFIDLANDIQKRQSGLLPNTGGNSQTFFDRGVDYEEYADKDVTYRLGDNNARRLAEAQPFTEKLNRTLNPIKLATSMALGIAENAGYIGDLLFDWDERDYTNALVDWSLKSRENLNKADNGFLGSLIGQGQAYQKDPSKVWDLTDQAWWLNNGAGLVESVGEFLVVGAGVGKGLSLAAKGLARASGFLVEKAALAVGGEVSGGFYTAAGQVSKAAAQIGTAGVLAYTEGAMSGAKIYKDVYAKSIDDGMKDADAKALASEAASKTVYTNTMINTLLNITSVGKLFNSPKALNTARKLGLTKTAGETSMEYLTRLKGLAANPEISHGFKKQLAHYGGEALQEGAEEVVNLYAEREGEVKGGLRDFNSFYDTALSSEAGLNFVLGAVGGVAQTAGMENIPFNKVLKRDAEGKPIPILKPDGTASGEFETEFKTLKALEKDDEYKKYISYVKNFSDDLELSFSKSKELKDLADKRDKEEITEIEFKYKSEALKEDLFNVSLFNSLFNGTAIELGDRFKEIANLDNSKDLGQAELEKARPRLDELKNSLSNPELKEEERTAINAEIKGINDKINSLTGKTEAMKMGLAQNMSDNYYKEEAQRSYAKIQDRAKTYNDLVNKYSYGDEETWNLAHHLFIAHNGIEDVKERIAKMDEELASMNVIQPSATIENDFSSIRAIENKRQALKITYDNYRNGIVKKLQNAGKATKADLKRYNAQTTEEVVKAVQDELDSLLKQYEEAGKEFDMELETFSLLEENEGLDKQQLERKYINELEKNQDYNESKEAEIALQANRAEHVSYLDALTKRFTTSTSSRGRKAFVENAKNLFNEGIENKDKAENETKRANTNKKATDVAAKAMNKEAADAAADANADANPFGFVPLTEEELGGLEPDLKGEKAAEDALNQGGQEEKKVVVQEVVVQERTLADIGKDFLETIEMESSDEKEDTSSKETENNFDIAETALIEDIEKRRQVELEAVIELLPIIDRDKLTPKNWVKKLLHVTNLGHLISSLRKHENISLGEPGGELNKDSYKKAKVFSETYREFFENAKLYLNNVNTEYDAKIDALKSSQEFEQPKLEEVKVEQLKIEVEEATEEAVNETTPEEKEELKEELGVGTVEEVKEKIKEKVKESFKEEGTTVESNPKGIVARIVAKIKKVILGLILAGTLFTGFGFQQSGYTVDQVESFAQRALVKAGVIEMEETKLVVDETEVATPIDTTVSEKAYEQSITKFEKLNRDNKGIWSYRNQWLSKNGFTYIAGVNNAHFRENKKVSYKGVEGIAHHLILRGNAGDLTSATSMKDLKNESHNVLSSISPEDFVPIISILGNDKVSITYKQNKDVHSLEENEVAPIRLIQFKVSNLDFDRGAPTQHLGKGTKAVTNRETGAGITSLIYANKDSYGKLSGGSIVLLFKDLKGNLIVREYAGSINGMVNEINTIKEQFGVTDAEITLGIYDAGAYTAKMAADDGTMSPTKYSGFHPDAKAGASLMIPVPQADGASMALNLLPLLGLVRRKKNKGQTFDSPDFTVNQEALIKRFKLVAEAFNILQKQGVNINNFAEVSYAMHLAIGKDAYRTIYEFFKGAYIQVNEKAVTAGSVTFVNKNYQEMFDTFEVKPDTNDHEVTLEERERAYKEAEITFFTPLLVNAANSLASKTRTYTEVGGTIRANTNDLFQFTNPAILTTSVKGGDEVTFRVVNEDVVKSLEKGDPTIEIYNDVKSGKRDAIDIPIQIVHKTQGVIGYVHDMSFIRPGRVLTKDGNLDKQKQALATLRADILSGTVKGGKVSPRTSHGTLSRNYQTDSTGKAILRPTSEAIKGDVEFVVYQGEDTWINTNTATFNPNRLINKASETESKKFYKIGAVYAVLPTPLGKEYAHLIETNTLNEEQADTVVAAIRASFNKDEEFAKQIESLTGDNIFTQKGLEDFVMRFVFSGQFNFKDAGNGNAKRHYLNIAKEGLMFFSQDFAGLQEIKRTKTIDEKETTQEKSNREFEEQAQWNKLKTHLMNSFFNINKGDIKKKDYVNVVVKDGKITSTKSSYVDVIKSVTVSDVNSLPLGNGKFAYFDNPVIEFEVNDNKTAPAPRTTKKGKTRTSKKAAPSVVANEGSTLAERMLSSRKMDYDMPFFETKRFNSREMASPIQIPTIKGRLRDHMKRLGILNEVDDILNYAEFLKYVNEASKFYARWDDFEGVIAKKSGNTNSIRAIFEDLRALDASINRGLKEEAEIRAEARKGLSFDSPQFKSNSSANLSGLKNSYSAYRVKGYTNQQQNDLVSEIAARAFEILKASDKPIKFNEVIKMVRESADFAVLPNDEEHNKFFQFATEKLVRAYKTKMVDGQTEQDNAAVDSDKDSVENTKNYESEAVFKEDSKKSIGKKLKSFMTFIRGKRDTGYGFKNIVDFDIVYNTVKALLTETPGTYTDMLAKLEEYEDNYEFMTDLIDQLYMSSSQVKAQFVTDMTSHALNFKLVQWENKLVGDGLKDAKGNFVYTTTAKVIDVNRSSITQAIKSQWGENFRNSSVVDYNSEEGKFLINIARLKAVAEALDPKVNRELEINDLDTIQSLLNQIGIEISIDALDSLRESTLDGDFKKIKTWSGQFGKGGIFGRIIESLNKVTKTELEEENLDTNNAVFDNTGIDSLAKQESLFTDRLYSNSFRDGEGNIIYTYSARKYFVDAIADLNSVDSEKLRALLEHDKFAQTSTYLDWFNSWPSFKNHVKVFTIDTLNKKGRDGVKVNKSSNRQLEMLKLSLFTNSGRFSDSGKQIIRPINMLIPTTSDKSVPLGLQTYGLRVKLTLDGNIDDDTLEMLFKIAQGELNRIRLHNDVSARGELDSYNNQEWQDGGGNFFLFPGLNEGKDSKSENHPLWNADGTIKWDNLESTTVKEFVKDYINSWILARADAKVQSWKDTSMIYVDGDKEILSMVDNDYINNYLKPNISQESVDNGTMKGAAKFLAVDYLANYMFAYGNMFQAVIGDPVLFTKVGSNKKVDIEETYVNLGKRLANQVAPGITFSNSKNEKFIYVFAEDMIGTVKNIKEMREMFKGPSNELKLDKMERVEKTDAQGYATWKTRIEDLSNEGVLSEEEGLELYKIFDKRTPLSSLNRRQLELIDGFANSWKPVYTQNQTHDTLGVTYATYVKLSEMGLAPQITQGQEIDKVRASLEALEKKMGQNVRLVYKSGAKSGAPNKTSLLKVWDENERCLLPSQEEWDSYTPEELEAKLDELFSSSSMVLSKEGLRKQQEVPYDKNKSKVNDGTQQRTLLFVDNMDIKDFKLNGLTISGRDLYNKHYIPAYNKLFTMSQEELYKKIEYNQAEGTVNIDKLSKLLQKEAEVRGYSINDKKALELELGLNGAEFKAPLWAVANSSKFESLLKSLVDNSIRKNKMNGRSFVLVSPIGFKPVREYNQLSTKEKSSIVYAKDFDYENGLRENEVLLSFKYKDVNGNALKLEDFTKKDENGNLTIDEDKITDELLTFFGYRIPTEGLHSMKGLKIAGFVPDIVGDNIIATETLISQMGSDFDIDKLYSFMYNTSVKEGKLSKFKYSESEAQAAWASKVMNPEEDLTYESFLNVEYGDDYESFRKALERKQIENDLLDIHLTIVNSTNPEVIKRLRSPSTYGLLEKLKDKNIERNTSFKLSLLDEEYQKTKYLTGQSSSDAIGVFALNMTFNAMLQTVNKDISLNTKVYDKETETTNIEEVKFSLGIFDSAGVLNRPKTLLSNRYRSEVMAAFTSSATDAEKLQALSQLNVNTVTYDAIRALAQLGFEEVAIIHLITQPIIVEYTQSLLLERDDIHKQAGDVRKKVKEAIIAEYTEKYGIESSDEMKHDRLSDDDMKNCLDLGESTANYGKLQLIALHKFLFATNIGDALGNVQKRINTASSGIGRDLIEVNEKLNGVMELPNYTEPHDRFLVGFENIDEVVGKFAKTPQEALEEGYEYLGLDANQNPIHLKPTSIAGLAVTKALKTASDIFNSYFPYKSSGVKMIFDEVEQCLNSAHLTVDEKRWIWAEAKKFLNSRISSGIFSSDDIIELRKKLLLDDVKIIKKKEVNGIVTTESEERIMLRAGVASEFKELKKLYPENKFLQSLNFKAGIGQIQKVLFDASKGENDDELSLYTDFVNLLLNPDTVEAAKRLVEYAFVNGGVQSATEFMRYISFEYLKTVGHFDELKKLDFNDTSVFGGIVKTHVSQMSNFVRQLFQHYPGKAFKIEDDLSQIDIIAGDKKDFSAFRPKKEFTDAFVADKTAKAVDGTTATQRMYKPYVSLFDSKSGKSYRLFEYVPSPKKGTSGYYKEIPTLGFKDGSEYNAQSRLTESIVIQNAAKSKKEINLKNFAGVRKEQGVLNASEITEYLQSLPSEDILYPLANYFSKVLIQHNPSITATIEREKGGGNYDPSTRKMWVGLETTSGINSLEDLEKERTFNQTFMHEVGHGLTVHVIRGVLDGSITDEGAVMAVNRLKRLKQEFVAGLSVEKLQTLRETEVLYAKYVKFKDTGKNPLTNEEAFIFEKNKAFYYPLINIKGQTVEEFITGVLTSSELQTAMNNLNYSDKGTFLERFLRLIAEVLNSFRIYDTNTKKEVNLNQDSILAESLKASLYLISFNPDTKSLYNEKAYIIEKAQGYQAFVGDVSDEEMAATRGLFMNEDEAPIVNFNGDALINPEFGEDNIDMFTGFDSPAVSNRTNYTKYKQFIEQTQSRIKNIGKTITALRNEKVRDEVKITRLEKRIIEIKDELAKYEKRITIDEIHNSGVKDIKELQDILKQPVLTEHELETGFKIAHLWANSVDLLFTDAEKEVDNEGEQSENVRKIQDLVGKAVSLTEVLNKRRREYIVQLYMSTHDVLRAEAELAISKDLVDVSSLKANMLAISDFNIPILSTMDMLNRKANFAIDERFRKFNEELNLHLKNLKGKTTFPEFQQVDSRGKFTGQRVVRFSHEYQKQRRKLREDASSTGDYKEFIDWLRQNTIAFDVSLLFKIDEDDNITLREDPTHRKELVAQLGEDLYKDYLEKQRNNLERYLAKKESFKNGLDNTTMDDLEKQVAMTDFENQESPFVWAEFLASGGTLKKLNSEGGFIKLKGYKYTTSFPKQYNDDGSKTGWWDEKFKELEKNPALYDYYKFIEKTLSNAFRVLPRSVTESLNYNFLPILDKAALDLIKEGNSSAALIGIRDKFVNYVSSIEGGDTVYGDINLMGGVDPNLRVSMLNYDALVGKVYSLKLQKYLLESGRDLDSLSEVEKDAIKQEAEDEFNANRSTDVNKIMTAFVRMSLNFEYKSKIEGGIKLIQSAVHNMLESQETQDGVKKKDSKGNPLMSKGQLKHIRDAVDNYVNVAFYQKKEDDKSLIPAKTYSKEEKKLVDAYDVKLKELKDALDSNSVSQIEYELKANLIKEKRKALGSNVSMQNVGRALLQYNQLRGMGWNVFAGITNLVYGWMSNTVHGAGEEDFTSADLRKARYVSIFGVKNPKTRNKIWKLMNRFDVLKESSEHVSGILKADKKKYLGFGNLGPFEIQKSTDYTVQSELMLAVMYNTKVTTLDGKEINLYEAFNENGEWNEELMGEDNSWNGDIDVAGDNKSLHQLSFKLTQLVKLLHANVDPNSPILIKSNILGKMLMQFRSWVPTGFVNRFGGEEFDNLLNRTKKGRYRSFVQLKDSEGNKIEEGVLVTSITETFKSMINILTAGLVAKNAGAKLSKVDRANLRKNGMELITYIGLTVMMMGLKGMKDDDDDESKEALNYMMNQGYRLQSDILFYTSPKAFENIADNALPIFGLVTDGSNFFAKSINLLFDPESDEYTNGVHAGESKASRAFMKMVPFGTQVQRNIGALENVVVKH